MILVDNDDDDVDDDDLDAEDDDRLEYFGELVNFSDSMNSFIQQVLIWLVQIVPKLTNWPNFYFFQLYVLTVHLLKVIELQR